jgi:hypothetical protein
MTNKEKLLDVIHRLPDDVSIDSAIDALCLIRKIEIGLRQSDAGNVISHADVKRGRGIN